MNPDLTLLKASKDQPVQRSGGVDANLSTWFNKKVKSAKLIS